MLNDPRSHGLWERTSPPAPTTFPLTRVVTADVAIVGAGFTGCAAALRLAEAGARVAVLEGAEVGFGGSGRNVGLVNAGLWLAPDAVSDILGPVYGGRLLELLGNAPRAVFDLIERHRIACEPEPVGTLHLGVGEKGRAELAERAGQWLRRGAPVELLDAGETAAKVGSDAYSAALLDRRAGTIQPLAYARGLADAAIAAGADIFTASPASGFSRDGTRWRVETPSGTVSADWLLIATNAYTAADAPWREIRQEIVRLPYFNIATAPLSDNLKRSILPERQGCWDTKDVLSSFRFDRTGRLIVGSIGALRGTGSAVHRRWARGTLKRLFPQLEDVTFEAEWYGWIGMTADATPRFHRLAERVLSISGYNGRGIAPGTVFGRVLADHVLGRLDADDLPLPVTEPRPQRFRAARETWYEVGSQVAHLSARR